MEVKHIKRSSSHEVGRQTIGFAILELHCARGQQAERWGDILKRPRPSSRGKRHEFVFVAKHRNISPGPSSPAHALAIRTSQSLNRLTAGSMLPPAK